MKKIFTIFCSTICFLASNNLYSEESELLVSTSSGIASGIKNSGVISWNNIPYAEPPVEELRWKAPRDIKSDLLIQDNKKITYCVQEPSNLGGADRDTLVVGSEDCLYLDIKAPKKIDKPLPVMFWIHGGGNTLVERYL